MKFTKMHGIANDYVYIDCTDGTFGGETPAILTDDECIAKAARLLSDRHCGVGGDGIILILPSATSDFKMRIFNADGSEGKMCGNGSRCVGKYVYDHNLTRSNSITLETLSGVKYLQLNLGADSLVDTVKVDMGEPEFTPSAIPVNVAEGASNVRIPVEDGGTHFEITAVSMGNPHGVIFVDEPTDDLVLGVGPMLEKHPMWPDRANIEFAKVLNRNEIRMRVWERGSGETMACGTGACATAVAAMLNGLTERRVKVHLIGGTLEIFWDPDTNHVMMTGGATEVFHGEVDLGLLGLYK